MRKRREKIPDPKGLKDLGTFLDPDDLTPVEDNFDDVSNCQNHFHREWSRPGLYGGTVKLGKICLLPDGNGGILEKKTRTNGAVRKVSYEPSTGRTRKEY